MLYITQLKQLNIITCKLNNELNNIFCLKAKIIIWQYNILILYLFKFLNFVILYVYIVFEISISKSNNTCFIYYIKKKNVLNRLVTMKRLLPPVTLVILDYYILVRVFVQVNEPGPAVESKMTRSNIQRDNCTQNRLVR